MSAAEPQPILPRRPGPIAAIWVAVAVGWAAPVTAATPSETDRPPTDQSHRTVVRPALSLEHWRPPRTVIPRARLEDPSADLGRVVDEEAGLRVTRLGGLGSFSVLSVRGSTADQVLVFVDGIPLNGAGGGPVDLSSIPLGPVGSIGVFRGMAPIVYGTSAIGGVVDIRTRPLAERYAEVVVGGGSFLTRKVSGFYGDGTPKASVAIALDYAGSQGDFSYLSDNGTAFDASDDRQLDRLNNDFDRWSAMLKAQVSPAKGVRLTVLNLFTASARGLAGTGLFPTNRSRLDQQRNLLGARLEVLGGTAQFAAIGYVAWTRSDLDDPLGEIGLLASRTVHEGWVPGLNLALRIPTALDGDGAWTLTTTATASYRLDRYTPLSQADRTDALRHVAGVAAELELFAQILDSRLLASLRYEGVVSEATGADSTTVHGASWRAAFVQDSLPDTRLMLSVGQNLRVPSLYEMFGDTGYVLGNPSLRPERSLNLELSATHFATYLGDMDTLKIEAAAFATWTNDLIQFVQNAQNVSRPENVDRALSAGVELGVAVDLAAHFRARTALTFTHTENTGEIVARRGKQLPFRPRIAVYGKIEGYLDADTPAVGEIGLSVDVDFTAGNVLDHANLVQVPQRVLIGVAAYAQLWRRQLRLELSARNLTSGTVQDLAGFPLPGVSFHGSLRWAH